MDRVPDTTWAYLRLLRRVVAHPAPATHRFVERHGAEEALYRIENWHAPDNVLSETMHTGSGRADLTVLRAGVQRDVKLIESGYARLITPGMAEWPAAQLDIGTHQPLALWARGPGDLAALTGKAVAVVGSRAVSEQGAGRATLLAHAAVARGYTVVSGGALGVDGYAHQGALARGGPTIVVLPCGVGKTYPRRHATLFRQVVEAGGLLVSEYPPDLGPDRAHFLERNRLVAALGAQTLVVEAGARSGTISTARAAHRFRRPVFAAAGSPGCDQLLTEGTAWSMRDIDDILHALTHPPTGRRTGMTESVRNCVNDDNPAVAVLVYDGQSTSVGDALCAQCRTCTDCSQPGVIFDDEYKEPWCQADADKYSGDETVSGPRIVDIDSDEYRQLIAA